MNATNTELRDQRLRKVAEEKQPSTFESLEDVSQAGNPPKKVKTSYDADSRILMSATFKCARAGCCESLGEGKQRSSKKVGCNYELVLTIRRDQPGLGRTAWSLWPCSWQY